MTTLKDVKQAHKELRKIGITSNEIPSKDYYAECDRFTSLLKDFLHENRDWALEATKNDLLLILSWCSSYRPREPHNILTSIAIQLDRLEDMKKRSK